MAGGKRRPTRNDPEGKDRCGAGSRSARSPQPWIGSSSLLSHYLSNFANYTATYGSLGAAIGLMTWMWMSAIAILLGAALNSEIERHT